MALYRKKPAHLRLTVSEDQLTTPPLLDSSKLPPTAPQSPTAFSHPREPPIPAIKRFVVPFAVYEDEVQFQRPASQPPLQPAPEVDQRREQIQNAKKELDAALDKLQATMARTLSRTSDLRNPQRAVQNKTKPIVYGEPANRLFFNDNFQAGTPLTISGYVSGSGSQFLVIPPIPGDFVIPQQIYAHYQLHSKSVLSSPSSGRQDGNGEPRGGGPGLNNAQSTNLKRKYRHVEDSIASRKKRLAGVVKNPFRD